MTMRAVTLRRKQERRKYRSVERVVAGDKKQGRDNRRHIDKVVKRQLRGYTTPGFEPYADWELELVGWKSPSPDECPPEFLLECIVCGKTEPCSHDDEGFDKYEAKTLEIGRVLGWGQAKPGAKFHRVSVAPDNTVRGEDSCPAGRKQSYHAAEATVYVGDLKPLESQTCAKCAKI